MGIVFGENLPLGFVNNKGTDQHLCYSLYGKYHTLTCYKRNSNFLASLCSWGDLFESRFVGNLEDRVCRIESHIKFYSLFAGKFCMLFCCLLNFISKLTFHKILSELPLGFQTVWTMISPTFCRAPSVSKGYQQTPLAGKEFKWIDKMLVGLKILVSNDHISNYSRVWRFTLGSWR